MSKRLQVLLEETEWREIQRLARAQQTTVAAWVRQVLRHARRQEPVRNTDTKAAVLRRAARHAYPVADIDRLLDEIERGYLGR